MFYKKINRALLVGGTTLSLLLSGVGAASANKVEYRDIPNNHWANQVIQEATALGYFEGDGNGNFLPDNNVSRAEFAQILSRMFDGEARVTEPFVDVDNSFWGKDAIEELLALGIINASDYSNKRFEPAKAMTRAELSKWLTNALGVKQPAYKTIMTTIRDSQHTLLPTTEYLRGGINKVDQGNIGIMLGTGLFTGYTDGSFKPTGNTSRSEVAALAIRFKNMQDKAPTEFNGLNELIEVSETATNMLAATKFEYSKAYENNNVKNIVNKPLTLNNNVGTAKINRLIFIEGHKTIKETLNSSIYAKMFVAENAKYIYEDSVHMYIDQTLVPNKKLDSITLGTGVTNGFINPYRLTDNLTKYNLITLPDSFSTFFKVGSEQRYWTTKPFDKVGSHFSSYKVNDGTVLQFYSTY